MPCLRTLSCAVAAALALLVSPGGSPLARAGGQEILDIEGNLVLVDEVYLAVVELPDAPEVTEATAREVAQQIRAFLRRAGYMLATVEATAEGGRILVTVDEGRLARVVLKGRNVASSLAMRLDVDLPFDVFNKPELERTLRKYQRGDAAVRYSLVPVSKVEHEGLQIDPLALLAGVTSTATAPGAYELHIDFSGGGNNPGTRLSVVAGVSPDSIRGGGELKGSSGIFDRDRWEVEAQVGANYFENLRSQADELKFSRVFGDVRWLTPAFVAGSIRASLRGREDLMRRQRKDLLVESYWWNRLEGAAGLALEPRRGIDLAVELGAQRRDLFAVSQIEEPGTTAVGASSDLLWFVALTGRLVFDPDRLRVDRRHRINLDVRQFAGLGSKSFWQLDVSYRRVFEFGWNELWLRSTIAGVGGKYGVADAIPMRFLRGVFGSAFYLDRAAAVVLDYRFSLQRDIFKVGVFHELAVFRDAVATASPGDVRVGNSFGPSFHALVLDTFQFDLSYAVGFLGDGSFDHGTSLHLEKAF
jgi:hypothetical protein